MCGNRAHAAQHNGVLKNRYRSNPKVWVSVHPLKYENDKVPTTIVCHMREGGDAGGVAREFYHEVSRALFNVDAGLFAFAGTDACTYQINPWSGAAAEDHLAYFRFAGLLMGKALLDGHHLDANLTAPLYRHMLGAPLTIREIEYIDAEVYGSIERVLHMAQEGEDIECLCLDFTTTYEVFGRKEVVELKPGGRSIEVTAANVEEWAQLQLRHRLFGAIEAQLGALLHALYSVVPQHLLFVFDTQELELLLCGLPAIDVDDWIANTAYTGEYSATHRVIRWFWQSIRDFSAEERARLLQFATGTSRVPAQGFCALQSRDGVVCPFTIAPIAKHDSIVPRAHTCFNRIDLPLYASHNELDRFLGMVTQMDVTGFQME